jgi:hypothetical protein
MVDGLIMIKPKNKYELMDIIQKAMDKNGPEVDLGFIDTSLITDMSNLFFNSSFNGDIGRWNVGQVRSMCAMFQGSHFNGDISQWDTRNVVDMTGMFAESEFNRNIGGWDISSLSIFYDIFYNSDFSQPLYKWAIQRPDLSLAAWIDPELLVYRFCDKWIEFGN